MINRSQTSKAIPLNIVGSSTFGRYPTISIEKTYNMFISDGWLVDYAGYITGVSAEQIAPDADLTEGRALHASPNFNRLVAVINQNVYLVNINYSQRTQKVVNFQVVKIGELQTTSGIVYIAENNKPQLLFSDNTQLYVYDPDPPMGVDEFSIATKDGTNPIDFIPGYIDFHDTYFLCAARFDGYQGGGVTVNNTWRLSAQNNGLLWDDTSSNIGFLQTKPDTTQAVIRFPSHGNLIFVMGKTVTEAWFDLGLQLFPYQRNNSYSIDYGCLNPATIAAMDEIVVWLASNEKSGPIIMYSQGDKPEKITTDGIDYLFSQLSAPEDSQAFLYRQDGHLIYHINFYTDNLSLFYDFNTQKFFHASDEHGNYFIASDVAFFNNQYYFVSKNNGNIYVFDTVYSTYDGEEVPRIRTCKNIRNDQQEPFIGNDCGFTIETGNTNYQRQELGDIYWVTESGEYVVTEGSVIFLVTEDEDFLETQDDENYISEQQNEDDFKYVILNQQNFAYVAPRIDLSISIDGGDHFSSYDSYIMPPIGQRKNKLQFWQLGYANDLICQFRFWGLGRFVATDGVVNIRQ